MIRETKMFQLLFLIILQTVPGQSLLHPVVNTGYDQTIAELIANFSQLRQDLDAFVIREQVLNRTVEILTQKLVSREKLFNHTVERLEQKMTSLENELNGTLQNRQEERCCSLLENRVNQSFGTYEVILHDVVGQLNTQEIITDAKLVNMSEQIRYLALSLFDVRKQTDNYRTSAQEIASTKANLTKTVNLLEQKIVNIENDFNNRTMDLQLQTFTVHEQVLRITTDNLEEKIITYTNEFNETIQNQLEECKRNANDINQTIEILQNTLEEREQELNQTIQNQNSVIQNERMKISALQHIVETMIITYNYKSNIITQGDRITTLENKVNQSFGAYEVIFHDVIDKMNTRGSMEEARYTNMTRQIHYMALSLLDFRKQFYNFSITQQEEERVTQNRLKELGAQIVRLNQSIQDTSYDIAFTVTRKRSSYDLSDKTVIYDNEITNEGNGYNPKTGIFTCKFRGLYVFTWSTMSGNSGHGCTAYIYRNGEKMLATYSNEENGSREEVARNTGVLFLNVGDTVWIQTQHCGFFYGGPYTAF